ncbi:MAG: DNA repair protein RadC [Ruminococcaceae bacterium]|nr:DNA repair protein RadC [Oscillospiraceae bacterium]
MQHDGHRKRMKERFLHEEGFEHFAQHEILELLLYSTIARRDTNPIAHDLIKEYGNIAGVFEADPKKLLEIDGIGENSAFLLSLIPHLARAYNQAKWSRFIQLGTTELAGQYAINLFIGKNHEEFHMICVDSNRRVIHQSRLTKGTINEVPAYPRVIVEEVLRRKAQHVIFAHNHPGGSLLPSESDKLATNQLIAALEAINVNVIDHIIVSGNSYYSMADMGLL